MTGPYKSIYSCFPELTPYSDDIYLVYASTYYDHSFVNRDLKDVLAEVRTARQNGKKKIVFFNSSETFMPKFFDKAQNVAELLSEIPRKDLFYSVGVPHGQEFYDDLCKKRGWENRFNILSCHHFESTICDYATYLPDLDVPYEVRPKEKLFVCFNKLHRKHRLDLLAEAIRNGWLDKSFYSFEGAWPNWIDDDLPISQENLTTIRSIRDKFPLRLNITENRTNPVDLRTEDLHYHQESYFSIVMETIFEKYDPKHTLMVYMDTLFLSEKIYKPFAFRHPFITFAWPGTLKALQERGFKTFHPYIDESYDNEEDSEKRFNMLVSEIKRLESFTTEQWLEWQINIKPIVEYNYKYLLSLTDHRAGPPVDHLFID